MEKATAIAIYRQYNVAMGQRDVTTLAQLLAPTFTLTHMTGTVQPRQQWLDQIMTGQLHYYQSKEVQVTATPLAGGWQVIGDNVVNASVYGGARQDWHLHTVMQVSDQHEQAPILSAVVTPY